MPGRYSDSPVSAVPLSLAARRNYANGASGMSLANGVAIPPHMQQPGNDGYRTPTGEDYERHRSYTNSRPQPRPSIASISNSPALSDYASHGRRQVQVHSPPASGVGTPQQSRNTTKLSLAAVSEKLNQKLAWKARIRHFTWTFFTSTMATGGIANVLYTVPFRFTGIDTIGTFFFLLNIVLFIINCICITLRFWFFPETFRASLLHPTESLFMPAAVVSFGTILINISQYGLYNVGPWLNTAVLSLFWLDVILAVVASTGTYLLMYGHTNMLNAKFSADASQVVYPDIHDRKHDPSLDLPCLSSSHHRTPRRSSSQGSAARPRHEYHRRRFHDPRHRLHGLSDDLCCFHIPAHDTEVARRKSSTRNVCECGT